MRRPHTRLPTTILALSALALLPSADAAAHQVTKAAPGADYKPLRGIGPARAAGKGLLRVKLKNDDTVLTHGVDAEPEGTEAQTPAAPGDAPAVGGPERQPVCASDHVQHVLYGYPADRPGRFASVRATILGEIKRMNAALNEEALASGGRNADYKVKCDGAGEIQVDVFRSNQTDAQTTFSGVLSAARAAGFDSPDVDYTIFFDSAAPPACGTGTYTPDERLAAENYNNAGGDYGVVYSNCWTDRTAMHENGHNQGAVQYDAPFSTGDGAHCNDGHDVMCYSDGGDLDVGMSVFCADKMRFDCRHDTYFDAAPEPGEYLASHWNLGSQLNRFITFDAPTPAKPACADGLDNDGDGRSDFPADPGCAAEGDLDEVDPAACADLRDNDGDGRKDYPLDPGCSSPLDGSEADPVPPVDPPSPQPVQLQPVQPQPATPRSLPTLSMSSARRYARSRIKRRHARAKRIRASCTRRTRTSARCKVRWRVGGRAAYSGKMVVSYRLRRGRVALAATATVRRTG